MCGIVGYISPAKGGYISDHKDFLKHAIVLDTIRGEDSTGVFYNDRGKRGKAGWLKQAIPGQEFVNTKAYDDLEKEAKDRWFCIGHNRAATVGGINTDSAHPFTEGPVTMVHNGTLRSTNNLPLPQRLLEGVEVDSHALCHNLAHVEPENAGEIIEKIDGAFALVWYDSRDSSLNICRNHERPFHMAQAADGTIYMASEAGLLRWMDTKHRLALRDIVSPSPGTMMKFKQDSMVPELSQHDLFFRYRNTSGYGANWSMGRRNNNNNVTTTSVLCGTEWRELTGAMVESLRDIGLSATDRLAFTPIIDTAAGLPKRTVVGSVDTLGATAILHGVFKGVVEKCFDKRWMIRPIGIKHSEEGEAIIVGRLLTTNAETDSEVYASMEGAVFYDINGASCTKSEWDMAVKDGCAWCTDVLDKPEDTVWTNGNEPICQDCVQWCGPYINEMTNS